MYMYIMYKVAVNYMYMYMMYKVAVDVHVHNV